MSSNILNVLEKPTFDNAIVNFEKHTHGPYSANNLDNNDEIRLPIQQQDAYTAAYCSSLYIRGQLLKADGTVSKTAFFDKMGLLFLFDEIRFEMNGITIDRCRNPGLTALMKGYVSFNSNEAVRLENAGWTTENFTDENGYFDVCIPLKICLGFAEDFQKIILNIRQELVLVRSNSDVNAIVNPTANEIIKVKLHCVQWQVPHVSVADAERLTLMKCLEKNIDLSVPFRSWDLHEFPLLMESQSHTWNIKTSSQLEKPRFIIFGFQCARKNIASRRMSEFDHCELANFKVFLNSESYPYDNLNINFKKNFYATLYEMYSQFQQSYYQKECEPLLSPYKFKSIAPLVVIDCSHQNEVLKSGAVDIRLEFSTNKNIPKETSAYCIIIHDRLAYYNPLTSMVRTY